MGAGPGWWVDVGGRLLTVRAECVKPKVFPYKLMSEGHGPGGDEECPKGVGHKEGLAVTKMESF